MIENPDEHEVDANMAEAAQAAPWDTYDLIYLASDEWGNEKMEAVAREWFEEHPELRFVQVYEHGGWHLGFRSDGSLWTTANDTAVLRQPKPQPTRLGRTVRRGV